VGDAGNTSGTGTLRYTYQGKEIQAGKGMMNFLHKVATVAEYSQAGVQAYLHFICTCGRDYSSLPKLRKHIQDEWVEKESTP
jgi:hypothetical protein